MSCSNPQKITTSENHQRHSHIENLRDSIVVRDSVFFYAKADSIFIREVMWRERLRYDTVLVTDTIRKSEVKEKIVEKKVIDWWGSLMFCGLIAFFVWGFKERLKRD